MATVLCYGIAVEDFVFQVPEMPREAIKYRATGFAAVGGGTGANAAVAVARLGGRSLLATALGDDAVGDTIAADLEDDGVDIRHVRRLPGIVSPLSAVFVDPRGERLVMNYKDPRLPDGSAFVPADLSGIDAVLADIRWEDGTALLFERAAAAGMPRILDADRAPIGDDPIRLASHVAFSAVALREMTGSQDPETGLAAIAGRTGAEVSVTDGARGVFWRDGTVVRHQPAFPVKAVDTLGAGDVFHGALALALAEGQESPQAYRFAAAAAAIKCTRFGGGRAGAPDRAAVDAFLKEHSR